MGTGDAAGSDGGGIFALDEATIRGLGELVRSLVDCLSDTVAARDIVHTGACPDWCNACAELGAWPTRPPDPPSSLEPTNSPSCCPDICPLCADEWFFCEEDVAVVK